MSTTPIDDAIRDALNYDSIHEAEKVTGKDWHEDEGTLALGALSEIVHGQRKRAMLQATDDTTLSNDLDNYLRIAQDEGFEIVLQEGFDGRYTRSMAGGGTYNGGYEGERYFVLFRPDGLLLTCHTHERTHINNAHLHFNWCPFLETYREVQTPVWDTETWKQRIDEHGQPVFEKHMAPPSAEHCSGCWTKDEDGLWVWGGNRDAREALRHMLREFSRKGKFLNPWIARPYLHMLGYGEYGEYGDGYSYEESKRRTEARLSRLPEHVQACVRAGTANKEAA